MFTKLVNLTPHSIRLLSPQSENEQDIAPSGMVARVATIPGQRSAFVPSFCCPATFFTSPELGEVEGLPREGEDSEAMYIVSGMVASHPSVRGRADVCSPGTGPKDEAVRGPGGQIAGVTRLIMA